VRKLHTRVFAILICIVFQMSMFQGVLVSGIQETKTENTTNVLVKYKKGTVDSEKKVKEKKKDNKVKGNEKFKNIDAYSMEVESNSIDELKNDPNIELVEEDSIIEKLDYEGDYKVTGNILSNLSKNLFKTNKVSECGSACKDGTTCQCGDTCHCGDACECGDVCQGEDTCHCGDTCQSGDICQCDDCKSVNGCVCEADSIIKTKSVITEVKTQTQVQAQADAIEPANPIIPKNTDSSKTTSKGDKIGWNVTTIGADKMHEKGIYGNGVKVAIFDSGIDLDNEDIEVAGGISFVDGETSYDDINGHGTAMAGVLAAKENGKGIMGIAPGIQLYSVKILNPMGQGRYSSIIAGIDWAIENDIKIISMSFGGNQNSLILKEAIKKATDNNILIIAASGNDGANSICYPAAYPEVICVGAVNWYNAIASFSNTGRQMDLVAPGVEVPTVDINGNIILATGTSASVPNITGAAALLLGEKSDLTNGQVKYLLYKNTTEKGPLELFGNGLVNVKNSYDNLLTGIYEEVIKDEDGDIIGESDVDVGGDGIVHALGCIWCGYTCPAACWTTSSSALGGHNSYYNGHFRLYYCTVSNCGHFNCSYTGSTAEKVATCTSCHPSHTLGGWNSNASQHWQQCTFSGCGVIQNTAGHTWSAASAHPHYRTCTVCGYFEGLPNVSWTTLYDANQHWQKCTFSGCNGSQNNVPHTFGTPTAAHPHTATCTGCLFSKPTPNANCCQCGNHNWGTPAVAHPHTSTCTRCTATKTNYSANCCTCLNSHNYGAASATHPHNSYCTRCGSNDQIAHFSWTPTYDANQHWQKCSFAGCSTTQNTVSHTFGTPAAAHPHYSSCTGCTFQKTNLNTNCCQCGYHTWIMTNDGTNHWYKCTGCPATQTALPHTWATRYDSTNHWEYCTASGCNATRNLTPHTINSYVISPTHDNVLGHLKTNSCTCGSTSTERAKLTSGCPSCVSPTLLITVDDFIKKGFTSTDTSYKPTIKVFDAYAGDTITCKYYIDTETTARCEETFTNANPEKTYTFNTAFNPLLLSAGAHTLRVNIFDGLNAPVEKSVCFFVRPYQKTYTLNCANNETTDMIFTASGIVDFTKHKFRITYLPADLDVLDLCTQTSKIDLAVGAVAGTNITITTFNTTSGIIEFTVSNPSTLSKAWKGIVDIVKFKSKKVGPINVTYEIQ